MKRIFIYLLILSIMLSLLFAFTGCKPEEVVTPDEPEDRVVRLRAQGGPITAGVYPLLVTLSNVIERETTGIQITVSPGGGAVDGFVMIANNETDMTVGPAGTALEVYKGTHKELPQAENLRAIAPAGVTLGHLVTLAGSDVKSVEDLRGKTLHLTPGSAAAEIMQEYLEHLGIFDQISIAWIPAGDAADYLKDRHIDALWFHSRRPSGGISGLAATADIRFLNLQEPVENTGYFDTFPVFKSEIPAGTYSGQNEPVKTIASKSIIWVHKDVDEEIVYNMTKAIYKPDSIEELIQLQPSLAVLLDDNPTEGIPVPLHPGAERYYKEQGIEILTPSN